MKALILNSGLGTRMGEITSESPKCMAKLLGGETIISRQLHYLNRLGIHDIVITTGPYSIMLQEYCRSIQPDMQISYVQNPLYKTTNYIYSIYLAQNYLQEDVILMHGDLVFEADVLQLLLASELSCMAVSTTQPLPQKDFKAVLEYENGISYIRKIGILYGAGSNALCGIEHVKELGYSPICFIDSNIDKAGTFIDGLPVKTLESINDEFNLSEVLFYITPNAPAKFEIMDFLIKKHKIAVEQIVNYERYVRKKICTSLSYNQLTLETQNIALCCNVDNNVIQPVLNYDNLSPEEVYRKYYQLRDDAIDSIKNCDKLCSNCKDIIEDLFTEDISDHIDLVAFGGGARCNFRCIYCGFTQEDTHNKLSKDNCHNIIKKLCAIAGEFRKNGKIDKYTRVIIANGEPVLNPDLVEVLETFYDNKVSIYTNASILSPIVCEKLRDGNSDLLISIDAGTAATFKYVKGVDHFDKVVENINVYAKYGTVNLKYILIPGVNIDHKNIEGFLSIAENIKANIVLSKDLRGEDAFYKNIDSIKAAAEKFVEGARIRGLGCTLLNF